MAFADQNTQWPIPKFRFKVDIGGEPVSCQEVSGLKFTTEVIEYRFGDDTTLIKKKIQGMKKFDNITLKKAVFAGDDGFHVLWQATHEARQERINIIIQLLDEQEEIIQTWTIAKGLIVTMSSPDLNAMSNELAVESIEIAHEGIEFTV